MNSLSEDNNKHAILKLLFVINMDWPKRECAKGSVAADYRDVWHGSEWKSFLVHPDCLDGPEKGEKPKQTSAKLDAYAEKHSQEDAHKHSKEHAHKHSKEHAHKHSKEHAHKHSKEHAHKHSKEHAHKHSARWLDWRQVRESYPYVLNTLAETNFNENGKHKLNEDIQKLEEEQKLKMGLKKLPNLPALYEFAICHKDRSDKRFKVYIGKTDDLHRRQNEYLGYEEVGRMWPFFEFALRNRCMVMRRYAIIGSDENTSKLKVSKSLMKEMIENQIQDLAVYQLETRFLSVFDYAFNGREKGGTKSSDGTNPPKRQLKVVVTSRCCFWTSAKAESAEEFDPDEWYHPPK